MVIKHITKEKIIEFHEKIKKYENLSLVLNESKIGKLKKFYNKTEYTLYSIVMSKDNYWDIFLNNLNNLIGANNLYTNKKIRDKLCDNVFTFLTELEFGNLVFKSGITPQIDKIYYNKNNIDYFFPLSKLYIEITTPKINKKDKETWKLKASSIEISFGVDNTIINKIKKQKMDLAVKNGFSDPILVLINGDYRGIDEINIFSAIEKLKKEKKLELDSISGILLMRSKKLKIFENSTSKNKLNEKNWKELSKLGITK